jgi:2-oxoglutarate ferredoxin oxidoreductase subunit gamma
MRAEIRFGGFGGQGVISAGVITGRAATIYDDNHAVMTQSYGPEARGGACNASVIISDQPINYPEVTTPDLLVLLSQEAYGMYSHNLVSEGWLMIDEDLVEIEAVPPGVHFYKIPATRIAEELGNKIVANVVILGALVALSDVISKEAMLEAVRASVPPRFLELNEKAFDAGYEHARGMTK